MQHLDNIKEDKSMLRGKKKESAEWRRLHVSWKTAFSRILIIMMLTPRIK